MDLSLVIVDNFDGFQPASRLGQWLLGSSLWLASRSAVREVRRRDPEFTVLLGPESLKPVFDGVVRHYATYPEENTRTHWDDLRTPAIRIFGELGAALSSAWASEDERRAWNGLAPWFVHKWTYRHSGRREIEERIRRRFNVPESGIVRVSEPIWRVLDGIIERRERRKHLAWQMRHAGRQGLAGAGRTDVVLLSSSLYSPRVVLPMVESLRARGVSSHVLAVDSEVPWPFEPGWEVDKVSWSYIFGDADPAVARNRFSDARRRSAEVSERFERAVEGVSGLSPSERADLRRDARFLIGEDWAQSLGYVGRFREIFTRSAPRVLVCTKHLRVVEGAAVEAAHARGIPVVFLDQLLISAWMDYVSLDPQDHVVVSGPRRYDAFRALGAAPEQIHRFGDTRFDALLKESQAAGESAFSAGRVPILAVGETLTEGTSETELKAYYQALVDVAARFPEADILLKIHPKQSVESFERQADEWNLKSLRWIKNASTYELIRQSALVMTHVSTVAMESVIMGKPVIVYLEGIDEDRRRRFCDAIPALAPEYTLNVFSREELIREISPLLEDPGRLDGARDKAKSFRRDFLSNDQISSSDKTAGLIASLVSGSQK